MNFKNLVCLVLLLTCHFNYSIAQGSKREYIVRDSAFQMISINRFDDRNIYIKSGQTISQLTADQVNEFGFSSGEVYESFLIKGEKRFAVRLTKGNLSLYKTGDSYILKNNKEAIIFSRSDYKRVFKSQMDCKLQYLPYKKRSLRSFVEQYNLKGCDIRYVPSTRIGIMAGFQPYKLVVTIKDFGDSDFSADGSTFVAGLFVDFPLYKPKDLSISAELYTVNVTGHFSYFQTDFNSIMLPLALKWHVVNSGVRVYVKPGPVLGYNKSSTSYFDQNISNVFVGFQFGGGVEKYLSDRFILHAEIKYINLNSTGNEYLKVGYSGLTYMVGISM